ncbi:MAG: hypothetical protein IID44_06725 [Planctomycetes bacterium]|nr:hypothetical protein [Planctomycetota bacterium]
MTPRSRTRLLCAAIFAMALTLFSSASGGAEPAPGEEPKPGKIAAKSGGKNVKLPGMVINFRERCVDIESAICLDRGFLELIACTKDSKEHESIVAVTARPMHIHAALLLLGANNGNPAMRKVVGEQKKRWINVPPKGDPVDVYLVFKNSDGKMVEHPISDFVSRSGKSPDEQDDADGGDAKKDVKFPSTFLFAGSHLRGAGPGPRKYLADQSGNVISIVTFGDELLCLPGVYAKGNDSLMWQVDARKLPKVGSKVTLRLRPQVKPAPKTGKTLPEK